MKTPRIGYLLLLSGLLITGSGSAGPLGQAWTRWPDVRDLFAAASARDQLQADYRRLKDNGRLSRIEDAEYAAYLGNLDLRIASQCSQLMTRHPQLDPQLLPCPATAAGSTASTATARQSLKRLEAELARELGSFDDMLLQEQQTISERAPRAPSAAANTRAAREKGGQRSADGQPQETGGPFSAEADAAKPRQGSASSTSGSRTAGTAYGTPGKGGNSRRPAPDIPRGSRDDVVARQLREAAESESDPELKRKLWAEYRRYTASSP